ncbi:hypothetical protein GH714_031592 [Hevea brasiliensis]|uniref:Pentacotripeptide-repeat region of PRORP domain-containing protein n=1 Tax=Hevea brasiliensis TaxID=3981 RepID=A0A6A6L647_HEVBR|nr:hypothetical protein GH714_031592 [Hevea brasiliensis]
MLLKCSSMKELKPIHAQIILNGLNNETLTLGKLISFCAVADAGNLDYGQLLFNQIPEPNKFMYNSLIRGYSSSNDPIKSILLYRQMIDSGLSPNEFTLPFVLKACASKSDYWYAREMFDDISDRTLVSWNSMIGGYAKVGWCKESFLLLKEMRGLGVEPDEFTLVNLLSICSQSCDIVLGKFVHLYIEKTGMEKI